MSLMRETIAETQRFVKALKTTTRFDNIQIKQYHCITNGFGLARFGGRKILKTALKNFFNAVFNI